MYGNKELIIRNIQKLASTDLSSVVPIGFCRDDKNPNCITVSLKSILNKNDIQTH